MPPLQINPMFAVPFAQDHHPDAERLNRELKALLLSREQAGGHYANPNPSLKQQPGVFESDLTLFSWPEPCIQELRAYIWTILGQTIQALNGYTAEQMQRLQIFSHTWYHVTRHGGFTILHTHPMASWSGVYCVAPGETPEERPESGNIALKAPYHHGTWNIHFKGGQLVLFPSWLQHEVMPFYGNDERITIAFNTWFNMREG